MAKKLIHTDKVYHGKELVIPYDGKIQLEADGSVIVSDEAAEVLLTIPNWESTEIDEELQEEEETEEVITKPAKTKEKQKSGTGLSKKDLDNLKSLSLEDLIEIAKAAEVTGWEKFKKNQTSLSTYLKNRLKDRMQ